MGNYPENTYSVFLILSGVRIPEGIRNPNLHAIISGATNNEN
jgi:hypothetical protein